MSNWTWQTIGTRRHLIWQGRVACGTIGIPEGDSMIPCRQCVETVLAAGKAAFPA